MRNNKRVLLVCLLLVILALLAGCSQQPTPYQTNDDDNYTVSVQYDANGGLFTTNTSIITDSYSLDSLSANSKGEVEIALLAPEDARRGNDAFTAVKSGYFLAGWYAKRTETAGGEENATYTYAEPWDFANDRVKADADGDYTAAQPVLTLYAAWVPEFTVDFYDIESGQLLDTYAFNPLEQDGSLQIPSWDEETGAMEMHKFPKRDGYTFAGAYYDLAGTQPVTDAAISHTGKLDKATGTATDSDMTLYVKWNEGEWYHIRTAEQFLANANINGHYILETDLDFTGKIWPTALMHGNFAGSIQGNGHTIRNVSLTQTNNSKVNTGLFGHITEKAAFSDVTFENVTLTIKAGTRVAGTGYGLLAGTVSAGASFTGVGLQNSTLQIDSGCYFGVDDYTIGLVCGVGSAEGINANGLTCVAVGDAPEKVSITVNGNEVSLEFAQ
ncbi:MAG: hypothetical protein IJ518_03705 [Clostridia bacterium]|nr:hypothetical protein [Clostridia bacterium]